MTWSAMHSAWQLSDRRRIANVNSCGVSGDCIDQYDDKNFEDEINNEE